jgi:hypothetical protein
VSGLTLETALPDAGRDRACSWSWRDQRRSCGQHGVAALILALLRRRRHRDAAAALRGCRRAAPAGVIGLTQFLAPVLQFLFGSSCSTRRCRSERWIGFALVWVA